MPLTLGEIQSRGTELQISNRMVKKMTAEKKVKDIARRKHTYTNQILLKESGRRRAHMII